jgi:hypothetical protein
MCIRDSPYKSPYEAMYAILKKDKPTKERIQALETAQSRVSLDSLRRKLSAHPEVREIVNRGLRETEMDEDIPGIVDRAKTAIETITSLRYPTLPNSVRNSIVKECASEIHKQRGLKNENQVLDQYEATKKTEVTERNTCMRYMNCGDYKLCGRIDGYVATLNRIVDSKERTTYWTEVPIYDEIQLRVYMELMGCPEAELIERFPNGKVRNTIFHRDADRWRAIHEALVRGAAQMVSATKDDTVLMKIISANTFSDVVTSTPNAGYAQVNYII